MRTRNGTERNDEDEDEDEERNDDENEEDNKEWLLLLLFMEQSYLKWLYLYDHGSNLDGNYRKKNGETLLLFLTM